MGFTVRPVALKTVIDEIGEFKAGVPPELLSAMTCLREEALERPSRLFVQVGYEEMAQPDIDRIFGYAGISRANRPIGVPVGEFHPVEVAGQGGPILLFPIDGLLRHLVHVAPGIMTRFEESGSMDALAELSGESMSAEEYLVGGLAELTRFCIAGHHALGVRW